MIASWQLIKKGKNDGFSCNLNHLILEQILFMWKSSHELMPLFVGNKLMLQHAHAVALKEHCK